MTGWVEVGTAALPVTGITLEGGCFRIHAKAEGPLHIDSTTRTALRGSDGLLVYVAGSPLGIPVDLDEDESVVLHININIDSLMSAAPIRR